MTKSRTPELRSSTPVLGVIEHLRTAPQVRQEGGTLLAGLIQVLLVTGIIALLLPQAHAARSA